MDAIYVKRTPSKSLSTCQYVVCFGVKYRFIDVGYDHQLAQTTYEDIKEMNEVKVDALEFYSSLISNHSYVGSRGVELALPMYTLPFGSRSLKIKQAFQLTDDVKDVMRKGVRYTHRESCRSGIHKIGKELKYIGYPTIIPSFPYNLVIGDVTVVSPLFDILPLKYTDGIMVDVSISIEIPEGYEGNVEIEYPIYLFSMEANPYTNFPYVWSCKISENLSVATHCREDGGWFRYETVKMKS